MSRRRTNAQMDRDIEIALNKNARYMLVDADTGKDMREAHDIEIKQIQKNRSRKYPEGIDAIELGGGPGSGTRPRVFQVTLRMLNMHQPTRAQRRDPTLPKGETFTCKDRNGKILGTSKSVEGAIQKAPTGSSYAIVRGEYTNDGSHHGPGGHGRQVAVREGGRWQRGF
jgi:hypothetical protein